ncbi:MAG: hypothetical protein JSW67_09215 [Candidatus Latescibacterota bacterium]|nr:MAG: hypothetical protein JSW67_09215 [Candidatus Latescibacterota bacterium]
MTRLRRRLRIIRLFPDRVKKEFHVFGLGWVVVCASLASARPLCYAGCRDKPRSFAIRLRAWQKNALLATASLLFLFAVAEAVTRLLWEPGGYQPVIRADPVYGWALDPGTRLHAVDTDRSIDFTIEVNALGLRDPERTRRKPPGVQRVLLLGDSMAFGTGIEIGWRYSDLLDSSLGGDVEVVNAAVPGWGTDQEFLYLCREGLSLEPDAVVLALCLANDVSNNRLQHQLFGFAPKPRFVLDAGVLVHEPPAIQSEASARQRLGTLLKKSRFAHYVGRHLRTLQSQRRSRSAPVAPYHPEDLDSGESHWAAFRKPYTPSFEAAFQVTEALIEATFDSCTARGVALILFAFPMKFEVDPVARERELHHYGYDPSWFDLMAPYERVQRLAERLEVPFISALDDFQRSHQKQPLFLARDAHPNAAGHAVAAASLEDAVRRALAAAAREHTTR